MKSTVQFTLCLGELVEMVVHKILDNKAFNGLNCGDISLSITGIEFEDYNGHLRFRTVVLTPENDLIATVDGEKVKKS